MLKPNALALSLVFSLNILLHAGQEEEQNFVPDYREHFATTDISPEDAEAVAIVNAQPKNIECFAGHENYRQSSSKDTIEHIVMLLEQGGHKYAHRYLQLRMAEPKELPALRPTVLEEQVLAMIVAKKTTIRIPFQGKN